MWGNDLKKKKKKKKKKLIIIKKNPNTISSFFKRIKKNVILAFTCLCLYLCLYFIVAVIEIVETISNIEKEFI